MALQVSFFGQGDGMANLRNGEGRLRWAIAFCKKNWVGAAGGLRGLAPGKGMENIDPDTLVRLS